MLRALYLIPLLLLIACGDVVTKVYPTLADAKRDHLFGRGWLPDILPASANRIRTSNNLDLNDSVGEFYFDAKDADGFLAQLQPFTNPKNPFVDYATRVRRMQAKGYVGYEFTQDGNQWVFFCDPKRGHCFYDMWLKRNG
jgi:hypothetical protein